MAKATTRYSLREFAIIGARARIQELQGEIDRIKKQFGGRSVAASAPVAGESGVRPGPAARVADDGGGVGKGRKRRKMSADARKRISDAQKARWAKQRAQSSVAESVPAEVPAPVAKVKLGRPAGSRRGAAGSQKKR
jgi:hypothetical protein